MVSLSDITPWADESLRPGFVEHQGDDTISNQMKAAGVQIYEVVAEIQFRF
jgi:hypothetical protein